MGRGWPGLKVVCTETRPTTLTLALSLEGEGIFFWPLFPAPGLVTLTLAPSPKGEGKKPIS
jgi:hypothetical protein